MHILVDHDANEYVREVVRQADGEVGGIGYIELLNPSEFYISEFVIIEQDAGQAHVDFEGKAYIEEITRAAKDERENQLRLSWHSHGSMDTYFSNTDETGVTEYAALGMPWLVSLVFNQAGKISSRVDIFDSEVCNQITISDMEYDVSISDNKIAKRVKKDLKKLVSNKKSNSWDNWNKQAWNSQKEPDSNKSSEIEPLYAGIDLAKIYQDDDDKDDDVTWTDKDYEDIARQMINSGYDPKEFDGEELEIVKDYLEGKTIDH